MTGWEPGTRIGDHLLREPLGSGGMGQVWLVEQVGTGARRALKLLGEGVDAELLVRFQREGEALARADHPHVVRVHAAGSHGGVPYLVLALAEGGDLTARLLPGPLPPREAARVVREVALGLEHAHARGVLHRDLKPSNVLFDAAGRAMLGDFGLARLVGASRLTRSSDMLGTPAYMAPEVAVGAPLDERTDVYGLGALLHHALTGSPPFSGKTTVELLEQVIHEPARPPSASAPDVPGELDLLVSACLTKDPRKRPASARAVADALERFLHGEPPPRRELSPWLVALAAASLGLLAGIALLALGRQERPDAPARASGAAPPSSAEVQLAPRPAEPPGPSWERRIREERDLLPRRVDFTREGEIGGMLDALGERLQVPAHAAGALRDLRGWAAEGEPRAQRFLAEELLSGTFSPSGSAPAEVEAAELLWSAARGPNGHVRAGALLCRLLRTGQGKIRAEPRAADALLTWLVERDPLALDPAVGVRMLERGGPGDLGGGLARLRETVLQRATEGRGRERLVPVYQAQEGFELTRIAGLRDGWLPAGEGDQRAAEEWLREQARARPVPPGVARWLATSALLDDPTAASLLEQIPRAERPAVDPRDLAELDGGSRVRRADGSQLPRLSDRHERIQDEERTRPRGELVARLRALAEEGHGESQWLLGQWLLAGTGGVAKDAREGALWQVRAGLERGTGESRRDGHDRARQRVGRSFFLGEPGFPRDARLGVRWLETALDRMAGKSERDRRIERLDCELWLGLAAHLGEGVPEGRPGGGLERARKAADPLPFAWHVLDLERLAREGNPRAAFLRAHVVALEPAERAAMLRVAEQGGVRER